MSSIKSSIILVFRSYFHFPLSPFFIYLSIIHTYYLIEYFLPKDFNVVNDGFLVLFSYLTLTTLYFLIETIFYKTRWFRFFALMIFLFSYALCTAYFFGEDAFPEFSLMYETMADAGNWGVIDVITQRLDMTPIVIVVISTLIFFVKELRKKTISRYVLRTKNRVMQLSFLCLLYAFLIVVPYRSIELVTHFFQSGYSYFFRPLFPSITLDKNQYPFQQESFSYTNTFDKKSARPHVFLIVIESFNEVALHLKDKNNQPIMPFFTELMKQGLFVEHYYSPSVLSIKGYGSLLAGIHPLMKGVNLRKNDVELYGLPQVFSDNGYDTGIFISESASSLGKIFKKLGFHDFQMLKSHVQTEDKSYWKKTWGYEDQVLMTRFFNYLDNKRNDQPSDNPSFYTLISLYNHCNFSMPAERRRHFKGDDLTIAQRFTNSIALTDDGLALFFSELKKREYLKDSLVIITGDHGYPLGNHDIYSTEEGVYDESYRVPLLMVWPDQLEESVISSQEGVFSHIDLAPTLIDLLKLDVNRHHFIGQSLFSKEAHKPTLLVQPYSGIHLQSIRYPYKYRRHLALDREWVFNLAEDPLENRNIIKNVPEDILAQLRQDLKILIMNQKIIDANQVIAFPPKLTLKK